MSTTHTHTHTERERESNSGGLCTNPSGSVAAAWDVDDVVLVKRELFARLRLVRNQRTAPAHVHGAKHAMRVHRHANART